MSDGDFGDRALLPPVGGEGTASGAPMVLKEIIWAFQDLGPLPQYFAVTKEWTQKSLR
jgi:hypothetical protein